VGFMNIYDGKLRDIHQNIRIYIAGDTA